MPLSNEHSIEHHALSFVNLTLPKIDWTHEGHFAAALWLLRNRPDLATPDEFRRLVIRYNEVTNTPNTDSSGYHHSITIASLRAAANHMRGHAADVPLHAVLLSLMKSPLGRTDWLLSHWRRETLFSAAARKAWVEPDITPLPF